MFEELRAEYNARTVGAGIKARIRGLVESMLSKRDLSIYGRAAEDLRVATDEVLQDFTIDVLLHEGQLAYIFDNVTDVNGFDRVVNHHLRRYLARTRERSIVDNLLDRTLDLLESDELVVADGSADERSYRLDNDFPDVPAEERADRMKHAASIASNAVPRIFTNPDERNPKVYSDEDLRTLLRIFLGSSGLTVDIHDLDWLFRQLLTPWITSVLGLDEAVGPSADEPSDSEKQEKVDGAAHAARGDDRRDLTPEEEAVVIAISAEVAASWTEADGTVFMYKLGNIADGKLAQRLGVSRPTAAKAKDDLFARLAESLVDVDVHLRAPVLSTLARNHAHLGHE